MTDCAEFSQEILLHQRMSDLPPGIKLSRAPMVASEQHVFERYRDSFCHTGLTSPTRGYEARYFEDEEVYQKALSCAATILAEQCPIRVFAKRTLVGKPTEVRVVKRTTAAKFPERYKKVNN